MKIISMSLILVLTLMQDLSAQDEPAETAGQRIAISIQGEYEGTGKISIFQATVDVEIGLQIIALGNDKFSGRLSLAGLPSDNSEYQASDLGNGVYQDGVLTFRNGANSDEQIVVENGRAEVKGSRFNAKLKRVVRESSTLGLAAPDDAVVLFGMGGNKSQMADKYSAEWKSNRQEFPIDESGYLMEGVTSRKRFGSHRIHVEFKLPFQPTARGQGRGNSGLYLQGRYEVQMLDSFGLDGKINECGAIYGIKRPDINMCFPPQQWQTYDIEFHAAKFDGQKKISDAKMTVRHNGVLIHDNVAVPRSTTASPLKEGPGKGPVFLQNHGNPVRYRNIWVQEIR